MLDERARRTKEAMELADLTKKEYEQAKVEVQRQIDQDARRPRPLSARPFKPGRAEGGIQGRATKQAQAMIERTRAELESEREKIVDHLRKEFVEIAMAAAEKVIQETLDKEKHRKLIEETLQQSTVFKKS